MAVSKNSIPYPSNWRFAYLVVFVVLPLGLASAEEEGKDWSAERREYEERVDEFTREIKELRSEGSDNWAKHLADRRKYCKSILPMLDQILKLEQELKKAQVGQDFDRAEQFKDKLESVADKFRRAERLGEMEARLSELTIEKYELAQAGDDKARQRVETFLADQAKLLNLLRDLDRLVETDDDKRIEQLNKQVDQREESLLLRIDEFHLERHLIEARQEGEDVEEPEADLQRIRNALRELENESSDQSATK